mmetsp:Transcript_32289/g.65965  ORF Transcript_32289/g.65965 Transcript_32289/m.65965 type:complete len:213 (-) Transcript_32289:120-758(-)
MQLKIIHSRLPAKGYFSPPPQSRYPSPHAASSTCHCVLAPFLPLSFLHPTVFVICVIPGTLIVVLSVAVAFLFRFPCSRRQAPCPLFCLAFRLFDEPSKLMSPQEADDPYKKGKDYPIEGIGINFSVIRIRGVMRRSSSASLSSIRARVLVSLGVPLGLDVQVVVVGVPHDPAQHQAPEVKGGKRRGVLGCGLDPQRGNIEPEPRDDQIEVV